MEQGVAMQAIVSRPDAGRNSARRISRMRRLRINSDSACNGFARGAGRTFPRSDALDACARDSHTAQE